ncbi:MAG: hypothetical protein K8F91_13525 [Candidatus Obscuribacterales bacterium]|nr:hypothetical protein [Candidatus Obscuribacterales bacterium]
MIKFLPGIEMCFSILSAYIIVVNGRFYLFINYRQAARLGHVGWGLRFADGKTCLFGSTDHLYRHHWWDLPGWIDYMYVPQGKNNDWWSALGSESDMYRAMSTCGPHIWYHDCKVVEVEQFYAEAAVEFAMSLKTAGWSVLNNNCVQQTYEIARIYGSGEKVPSPWRNSLLLVPRLWYPQVEGSPVLLNSL